MQAYLSEKEERSVERIVEDANTFDGTGYTAPLDADVYYLSRHQGRVVAFLAVYIMGDTVGGRPVEEVLVFTHPEYRRHGRGMKLFRRLMEDLEEFSRPPGLQGILGGVPNKPLPVLRFSAYPSEVSIAFLTKLGAVHDHDEVLMRRHLGTNNGKELEELEFQMDNEYSECSIKTYGTVGYIYGVRTDTGHLREGSAGRLLHDAFTKLYELGAEDAVLEVSSANIPAYHLYQKLQFEVRESLQIWNLL